MMTVKCITRDIKQRGKTQYNSIGKFDIKIFLVPYIHNILDSNNIKLF